ncbi:MAG TPA: 1-deoxy-D-xylulose-5-phosphate reductoisomerase [Bryobacteraceae bacterium]|nr:1-deoxy-D-xylulose-5-phosphate reductoisomerase [Bryobacteraceae bacterium]
MRQLKTLTILGSTGSIGVSTLDVVGRHPDQYRVHALVAGRNVDLLTQQILRFKPRVVATATDADRQSLISRLKDSSLAHDEWPELKWGAKARIEVATEWDVDFVMSAIVGVAGLEATYEAILHGKRVGLANKEVLVASGKLVIEAARKSGTELIPVDSEHNGAHQCLRAGRRSEVSRLILTASGGPFRETPIEKLARVTPAEALNHPTWKMGQRITIDSATLMNKGFEVIEACWLFDFSADEVDVVVHPQSTVHAMVEYSDGSVIAQISATDMRMPIQYALTYPERESAPVPRLDWTEPRSWNFSAPDFEKFPALRLAYQAQRQGGSATCTLNAADEIAVEAFLAEKISFPDISAVVEETLARVPAREAASVQEVLEIDQLSRSMARQIVEERSQNTHEERGHLSVRA